MGRQDKVAATKKSSGLNKKGQPSTVGQNKASVKNASLANKEKDKEVRQEFMKDEDEPANNIKTNNPNRNTDKPDIDKPSYS